MANTPSGPILGCIADDFTGATDLASQLVSAGMRTLQTIGIPDTPLEAGVDAVVVALKSRTIPASEAIKQSIQALDWLREQGCEQFYFKYCSTFDSTPAGNIGPVTEALMEALDTDFTVACPALPANRRSVFNGYLFANGVLLNESGMQDHPLTPMTDANLVRVLGAQTTREIGLIDYATLRQGDAAVTARIEALKADGIGIAICDAIDNEDLFVLARACRDLPLVTAGSGLALGLPANVADRLDHRQDAARLEPIAGREAVLSGSCSRATLAQIDHAKQHMPSFHLDAQALHDDYASVVDAALASAEAHFQAHADNDGGPVLIYASAAPEEVRQAQQRLGVQEAGELVERALAEIASELVGRLGVRRLLVAGGETSGAVVSALGVQGLRIGESIDPGVPWTTTLGTEEPLALALKSGNFGATDFMTKAWNLMP
ncbi:3-oxo-tetronate kinase [Salinicola sp. LHM]|uniref:3-oxo-tetronate kinase n=1 Tax=Salinicola sp. LHM TaxID=3065298 RepID=UPI002ACE7616|nr:3-oxo-tetronate kinase [Salinicola sp. LHM]MED5500510.1 3-oxo-tetronate kinase [Pseudomonadota bacterium]WQH33200.1 3-oxo-tetronate kinase [Salinicola sp. LHM]